MELFEAIKGRRSVRSFEKRTLPEEQVYKLIDAARLAPSAGNIQPWEFVIVRDPLNKKRLAAAALDQSFIEEAPVVIVVCADEARSARRYMARGANLYCIQDTAAATTNLLLAAHAMKLGACWVGAFREEQVRIVLNTPTHVKPVAIIPVGYPTEKPLPRKKREITEIVHKETF